LREDLPAGARRLAEALRGYADAERAFGASESAEVEDGDSRTVASQTSLPRLLKPSGGVDLPECWSALETVRAEIVGEPDPALRAVKHSRLDSAALELADAALDRRFALHRQIVQDISHDVRSPLSSILLLADSLLNGPGPLSPLQRRQASILYDASVSLVRLVNDIIDVSRMDHEGEIPVERVPFSVPELLEEVGRLAMPFAEHRAVELVMEAEGPRRRLGDRRLLCRVLVNLVSNGIEASGESGRVEVRLADAKLGDLHAEIVDSGLDADIERLRDFLDASREPYPRRQEGWTRGLGLAISGRLVRAADGAVRVDRLEDGRTRFQVDIPFREA
jgi:signal transduction histidine kinase